MNISYRCRGLIHQTQKMNRLVLGFMFFCALAAGWLGFPVDAQDPVQEPQRQRPAALVKTVTLVDDPPWIKEQNKDQLSALPNPLMIAVHMNEAALFKISLISNESSSFSTAGQVVAGTNMIALATDGLFGKSGSYTYALAVKAGDVEQHFKILLDIKITDNEAEKETVKPRVYQVSLLVGNRLIGSLRKEDSTLARLIREGEKGPAPIIHDPRYPVPGSRPPAASVSPLALAALAVKGIKNRIKKNKQDKILHFYTQELTGIYLRKNSDGKNQPLTVTFKIHHQPEPLEK